MAVSLARHARSRTPLSAGRGSACIVALLLVVLIAVGAVMATLTVRWVHVLDDRREVLQGPATVERLRTAYVDEETAIPGYLLTRDRTFLEPFDDGQRAMAEATASLRESFRADRNVLVLLDAATVAGAQWTVTVAQPVIDTPGTSRSFPVDAEIARASFDEVRTKLEVLATRIDQLAADAIENSNSARTLAITAG